MKSFTFRSALSLPFCMLGLSAPGHAEATTLPVASAAAIVAAALPIAGICVTYTYDVNGNRVTRTVEDFDTAPVNWGSGVYGCFIWSS